MQKIVDYVDDAGISLTVLAVEIPDEEGMSFSQLKVFYGKFGFKITKEREACAFMERASRRLHSL